MNLTEYQEKARSTAIYLDIENSQMIYPALGIIGECGEVAEKVKKLIRDDVNNLTSDRKLAIAKELGDCCWYLANICCDVDLELNMMYEMRGYSTIHKIHKLTLPQLVFYMNRHANSIAELLEFWYYYNKRSLCTDGENAFSTNHKSLVALDIQRICPHVSHIVACIEEIAKRCDFTLEEIYVANIKKLLDRKERNVLKGEGDNR